ncbi:MAG TPA: hypothetical protein PK318_02695 [Accumulibacter sp.]|nr:hypothetical protein [Accumulibacter sp.]HMW17070.1 hypothetical protein [Accumulibacter sp.]HNE12265.1 hypothetical protein [Accumulibacter sp.]
MGKSFIKSRGHFTFQHLLIRFGRRSCPAFRFWCGGADLVVKGWRFVVWQAGVGHFLNRYGQRTDKTPAQELKTCFKVDNPGFQRIEFEFQGFQHGFREFYGFLCSLPAFGQNDEVVGVTNQSQIVVEQCIVQMV